MTEAETEALVVLILALGIAIGSIMVWAVLNKKSARD